MVGGGKRETAAPRRRGTARSEYGEVNRKEVRGIPDQLYQGDFMALMECIPVATMSTSDMVSSGAQAFRTAEDNLVITRDWLSNNTQIIRHLLG